MRGEERRGAEGLNQRTAHRGAGKSCEHEAHGTEITKNGSDFAPPLALIALRRVSSKCKLWKVCLHVASVLFGRLLRIHVH